MPERELTAGIQAAIAANPVRPILFIEIEHYAGGIQSFLRLATGVGQITWNGNVWTGGGDMLALTPARESEGLEAIGFAVTLSGMPADKLAIIRQSMRKNKSGKIYLGFLDAAGAVIADPYLMRRGRFDTAEFNRDPAKGIITITARYEDRLIDLERPREFRYTTESQALRLAGDRGFEQVPELQDAQDLWGAEPPSTTYLPASPWTSQ